MTAEIAIINRGAIALAADSKVTLSHGGKQKTYDTVNKLFALSKTEPVGAMIYGNAEFVGFPWETIVKEYRRRRPNTKFDTIIDVAADFKSFLVDFFPFTTDDEDRTALTIAHSWFQRVVDQSFQQSASMEDFNTNLLEALQTYLVELERAEAFLSDEEWKTIEARIGAALLSLCSSGPLHDLKDRQVELYRLLTLGITKKLASPATSGIVIAGFGDRELLPSLVSHDIDGILCGRIKAIETNNIDITRKSNGVIIPFAQTDMVYRFMEGIDPEYATLVRESLNQLLIDNAINTASALGIDGERLAVLLEAFNVAAGESVDTFWAAHERHRRERYVSPIIEMVSSLPKDELANLAESLVSLTSLQRRVSREIETVGGAVDVAVISKGDGFVWVKRKHYFPPDRNLRYINSYFMDCVNPNNAGGQNADDA
ncbi:hypothetical protein KQ944_12570 [Bacillus subtilis]|uniref:hypothetical protein n=1 Tax=Pseudochrobactrum asaccharolyticum TaxID=354351 RepID=UPI001F19291D|nr:hypothetical protein [Pseudochrobactrum asaccharolyticum]MCF7646000.1 hypothetical protein [Pseudochrobactrum asaccharolyticum]MCF7672467.1 hypothetical protein [Bacillus subtilis]